MTEFEMPEEGFTMESNMFRPGRDYRIEPLSEFELTNFKLSHPEYNLPTTESMLNAQEEVIRDSALDMQIPASYQSENIDRILEDLRHQTVSTPPYEPYTPPSIPRIEYNFNSDETEEKPKEEEGEQLSALGEVGEALSFIFNPLKWFSG